MTPVVFRVNTENETPATIVATDDLDLGKSDQITVDLIHAAITEAVELGISIDVITAQWDETFVTVTLYGSEGAEYA